MAFGVNLLFVLLASQAKKLSFKANNTILFHLQKCTLKGIFIFVRSTWNNGKNRLRNQRTQLTHYAQEHFFPCLEKLNCPLKWTSNKVDSLQVNVQKNGQMNTYYKEQTNPSLPFDKTKIRQKIRIANILQIKI